MTETSLTKVTRNNLTSQVYQELEKALMTGQFLPGDRLNIKELADKMETSQTPVREALLRLASFGALEMKYSRPILIPVLSKERYLENRAIRIVNEGLAVEVAAKIINAKDIARLREINQVMLNAKREGRYKEVLIGNHTFHIELCRAARMPNLLNLIEILWLQIGPSLNLLYPATRDEQARTEYNYHAEILDALENRDPKAAVKALQNDLIFGGRRLLEYFEQSR